MAKIKAVSLFSGCGGGDLGILGGFKFLGKSYHKHPVDIVYANDIEKTACEIYNSNFSKPADCRDIREIHSEDIPSHDILVGGFPCQSFSIIAQNPPRLGIKDENGKLFFEMVRILKDKRPKVFIAENVRGILSANRRRAFPLIMKEFEETGYVVDYKVLNSVWFGVPQKRQRVFIIGWRKDLGISPTYPTVALCEDDYVPLRKVIFPENEIDSKYYFSERAIQGMLRSRKDMDKGRPQDINKPCNTVGAHLAKVSLNSTDPVLKINGKYRRFTPREVARIQSFPDNFKLVGSESAQYKALGNAIPPVLMWYVFKVIVRQLEEIKHSPAVLDRKII